MPEFSPVPGWLAVPYFVAWATLMRALLVRANVGAPTCARCALRFERSRIGEPVCSCSR